MIYITNPIFATAWKITPSENGKYIDLQITTSEKDNDGNYINSNWFPRAIGHAVNTLKRLKRADRFTITKAKITNERRDTDDGKKSFFRFIILEATIDGEENSGGNTPAAEVKNENTLKEDFASSVAEDTCPW